MQGQSSQAQHSAAAGIGPQQHTRTEASAASHDNMPAAHRSAHAQTTAESSSYEEIAPTTSAALSSLGHSRTSSYNSSASHIGPLMHAAGYRPGQANPLHRGGTGTNSMEGQQEQPYDDNTGGVYGPAGHSHTQYLGAPMSADAGTSFGAGSTATSTGIHAMRHPGLGDRSNHPSIDRVNSDDTHNTYASWAYERALSAQMQLEQMKQNNSRANSNKGGARSHFLPWRKNQRQKILSHHGSHGGSSGHYNADGSSGGGGGAGGMDGSDGKLDTLSGVFLPCLSQILGIIFYLRLPTITAQAGCIGATAIIAICVLSTFVTSLSLSAIATNGTIQAGGPYYIISRTLGVEIGGSLGLLFYFGNTIGAAMYVLGAVEAFQTDLDLYGAPAEEAAEEEVDDLVAFYGVDDDDDAEEEEYIDPNAVVEEEEDDWFGNAEIAAMVLMFVLAGMVGVGMKYVNYTTGTFLSVNALSIFSILLGAALFGLQVWDGSLTANERSYGENIWPSFSPDPKTGITPTWASLLALFYPSVTGIMAGTNRSGKLAKPSQSIPKGTISAITVTSLLYFLQVWLVGNVVSRKALMENKLILACLAWPSRIVIKGGIITAAIGAALQCLSGAPQLLAAIAVDDAIPYLRWVKPYDFHDDIVTQKNADPKAAIFVTYIIASAASLVGNLDHITPLLTNCFLLMYGGINLCCFLLGWINAPGFRPSFRFYNKHVSLFGAILCMLLAFSISWFMAFLAIGLFFINYVYIRKMRQLAELSTEYKAMGGGPNDAKNLGDIGDSLRYKITMMVLMNVTSTENFHAKNWRPQLLTVVDTDDAGVPQHMELIALAAQLKKGRGLNVILSVKRGSIVKPGAYDAMMGCRHVMKRYMAKEGLEGYASISVTHQEFSDAVLASVMSTGIGPISPNIVMLPFLRDYKKRVNRAEQMIKAIQGLSILKRAVVLFKGGSTYPRKGQPLKEGQIDIYWVVEEGGLCLLLPYLLSQHRLWRKNTTLRIFAVATNPNEDLDLLEASVIDYCESVRIEATVNVIDMARSTIATDMTRSFHPSANKLNPYHPYQSQNPYERRMTISKALSTTQDFDRSSAIMDETPRASSTRKALNFDVDGDNDSPTKGGSPNKQRSPKALPAGDLETSPSFAEALQRPTMGHGVDDTTGAAESPQMLTAKMFNNIIRFYSHSSNLVVTNMPLIESMADTQFFFSYIERLSMCVDNIMLVRGSEYEVVTTEG